MPDDPLPSTTSATPYGDPMEDGGAATMKGEDLMDDRYAPATTPSSGSNSGGYGDGRRSRTPENSMILRRREANRLAAQRFRNRKKGYQDSLEERVRDLENERASLVHRLEQVESPYAPRAGPSRNRGLVWASPSAEHRTNAAGVASFSPAYGTPRPGRISTSDLDLRVASLEAANRHLQDSLKAVTEENDRLKRHLDQWVDWERSLRSGGAERAERAPDHAYALPQSPHHFMHASAHSAPPTAPNSAPHSAPHTCHARNTSPSAPPALSSMPPQYRPGSQISPLPSPSIAYLHHPALSPARQLDRSPLDRPLDRPHDRPGIDLSPLQRPSLDRPPLNRRESSEQYTKFHGVTLPPLRSSIPDTRDVDYRGWARTAIVERR